MSLNDTLAGHMRNDRSATDAFYREVYAELRRIAGRLMRSERPDHTLQPTALIHEAYLRLIDGSQVDWRGRAHFCNVAAVVMRRVLNDHADRVQAAKRGGDKQRVAMDDAFADREHPIEELIALDEAIDALSAVNERVARVARLRIYGGLKHGEAAYVLKVSERTVAEDWKFGRSWLAERLQAGGPS